MFHYHRIKLLTNEIQRQHGVSIQGIKTICMEEVGPSIKTFEKMCYDDKSSIFKKSYLDFITSLNRRFSNENEDYLDARTALKNFLKDAKNEDLITLDKLTLQGILMYVDSRADYYTNDSYLTYSEWLGASEYNESLLTPSNPFDFSPQNEFCIRQYFDKLNVNLVFQAMPPNRIEIYVNTNKYSPFKFQLFLRSCNFENENTLWCSEIYIEVLKKGYIFEEIAMDIIEALELYANEKNYCKLHFTTNFYEVGGKTTLPYVKPFEEILENLKYTFEKECSFSGRKYTGYFKYLNNTKTK